MKYRAEIDGLRAVAIIPVIFFHAGFELFSGGFIGVDVFFVISGYLITTLLIEDIEKKQFSILKFYERRARRILPALFFLMFVCILFAWVWMLPDQMKNFSQSLVAVSLFLSNILFWRESGYFDSAAEEKPLLHTWSLAVEEQYYVLFPIFLILTWRFGKKRVFWIIVIIAAISLILSEWGWRKNANANFYLAHTRAWEIFAGSISAFIVQKNGVKKNNLFALFGLTAIIFSIFVYDEKTPFPSIYSLIPVVGAMLFVLYADKQTYVAKILSNKLIVGIGLISYSTYLWHQPLFAFARIKLFEHPSALLMTILIFLSIILGYLSWRFVEKPFRIQNKFRRKQIFIISLLCVIAFTSFGLVGHFKNGIINRFSDDDIKLLNSATSSPLRSKCHFSQKIESIEFNACNYFSEVTTVAVFGDSHATELAFVLAKELEKDGKAVLHHTMSGCRHNFRKNDEYQSVCYNWHEKTIESLKKNKTIKTVILSYRNEKYIKDQSYRKSLVNIADTLASSDKKVILVLQAPLPGVHINKYLNFAMYNRNSDIKGLSRAEWNKIYFSKKDLLKELPDKINVVDPEKLLCDKNNCFVIKDYKAFYFDDNHLSLEGANVVAQYILNNYLLK